MNKQEFFDRTNKQVTDDEYAYIEQTYMATTLDKDQFCKEYIKSPSLIAALAQQTQKADLYRKMVKDIAVFIAEEAETCSSTALRDKAVKMMGAREYLKWKLTNGYNLWKADEELLLDVL